MQNKIALLSRASNESFFNKEPELYRLGQFRRGDTPPHFTLLPLQPKQVELREKPSPYTYRIERGAAASSGGRPIVGDEFAKDLRGEKSENAESLGLARLALEQDRIDRRRKIIFGRRRRKGIAQSF